MPVPPVPISAYPHTYSFDDPFAGDIPLPFIAVGHQRIWQDGKLVTSIAIVQIGSERTEVIDRLPVHEGSEAVKTAVCVAAFRDLAVPEGIHVGDTIAALEWGIRAEIGWQRSRGGA